MIGSTGPTAGQLYIVDTFMVVVFGGAQSLLGTIASALNPPSGVSPARASGPSARSTASPVSVMRCTPSRPVAQAERTKSSAAPRV